ncbi:Hypothetical protein, putative [Bodo saltans]|uniref:MATH domain-containing protein n=1 Tax=Bodo saltans TaxID=75058 RepID=A0A0S4JL63_BODSA|nr:Hypothetical protein, putative [Bodo saltans]|eukprot:CUG89785.1 Hypothetical protein, putative [Bodo saltans]
MDRLALVESFGDRCSLWRYRVPVEVIAETVAQEGSRYSQEFVVGSVQWRVHLQHRSNPQTNEVYLAVHLQCCSVKGAYGHFRITICNRDPSANKSKTFHCHFKKSGSAWGLHQFIPLDTVLSAERGYLDDGTWGATDSGAARRGASAGSVGPRYVVIDVLVNVLEPGVDGSYSLGSLPQPAHHSNAAIPGGPRPRFEQSAPRGHSHNRSSLAPPPPPAVRINAHRCVVATRMGPLLPQETLPLQEGCTVSMQAPMEVFSAFLRYIYTEEYPESGVLRAESLLDLYLLAAQCEYYDLCGVCLRLIRPLLHAENILPLVLTRFNAADETLTSLYVRVLLDHYDVLITNRQFEEIPGQLFRRLSLILRDKEKLPPIIIPPMKHTLGKQLAQLVESGAYSDLEMQVRPGLTLKLHKYILASRSVVFSQAFHPSNITRSGSADVSTPSAASSPIIPSFESQEFQFSPRAWTKGMGNIYRRHLESNSELAAEDICFAFKLNSAITMDGHLKRESEAAVGLHNALRVLISAVRHNVVELRDRSLSMVAGNFAAMMRQDPAAWEAVSELPQSAVVGLFRMITETNEGR